jgi:hypothetical protein
MLVHWAGKRMKFRHGAKIVRLQGVFPQMQKCQHLSSVQLRGVARYEACEKVLELRIGNHDSPKEPPAAMAQLIEECKDLFQTPKGLPPPRVVDHTIPLLPGAQPFRLRPYRYTP